MAAQFPHQVGGHPSTILSSPLDSSTLIKQSSTTEHAFYSQVGPALHPDFIGVWTPAFYGTLTLQGKVNESGSVDKISDEGAQMLVLENLTHHFLRPNVLDIKLGTQLHDEAAPLDKVARMKATADRTTSGTTGVRLTGFQVWDKRTQNYVVTDKTYGKSLSVSDLPAGLARFFGPAPPSPSLSSDPTTTPAPALPPSLLLPVLQALLARLDQLVRFLEGIEIRMRGASLLLVLEGDEEAMGAAVERWEVRDDGVHEGQRRASEERDAGRDREQRRADERDEHDDHEPDAEDEDGDEDDSSSSSISSTDSSGLARPHKRIPFELRLIDFAHTRAAPGEGPDVGVLLGLATVRRLLEGEVERVGRLAEEQERKQGSG